MLTLDRASALSATSRPARFASPGQRRSISEGRRAACDSLIGRKIPCSNKRNSLFSEEQGIGCKPLTPLGDQLAKPREEAVIPRILEEFPVIFPGLHPSGETRKLGTGCDWGLLCCGPRFVV